MADLDEGAAAMAPDEQKIPENWKVIEVTYKHLEKLIEGTDKKDIFRRVFNMLPPTVLFGDDIYQQMRHLYLLIDTTTPVRTGYGLLAVLSVRTLLPYSNANGLIHEDMRFTYKNKLTVLLGFIDLTISFVTEEALGANIKERVKANLAKAMMSAAKYITNKVSRILYEDYISLYPKQHIDGVLLASMTLDSARPRHRRNGKRSACTFLDQFTNPVYPSISAILGEGEGKQIETMYNLYLANGETFAPGNPLFDSLLADGADLHVRIPGSDPNNFEDSSFKCSQSSKGGCRRTRRHKQKRRKTQKR